MSSPVKTITWILGIVLLVTGILGFVNNPVLGIFQVDTIHDWIHILSGVIALIAVMSSESYARLYLIVFGIVYGIVAVVGFVNAGNILNIFTVNPADNYLHAAIALVCLGVGFGSKK
jgi:uncharacterized membrane protein HdeD (DUF308 family)